MSTIPNDNQRDDVIEMAAREMWRQEHGRISSHDSVRTSESDERESAEDGYRQWDRSVSEAVKDACRKRMARALAAAGLLAARPADEGAVNEQAIEAACREYASIGMSTKPLDAEPPPWQRFRYEMERVLTAAAPHLAVPMTVVPTEALEVLRNWTEVEVESVPVDAIRDILAAVDGAGA